MAFTAPYSSDTIRIPNALIPGNETSDSPVEFDIVPAWGGDLARLKSVVIATAGMTEDSDWSPKLQEAVIKAFDTGAPAFVNVVTAVRNLDVPAPMAKRAGLLLPKGHTTFPITTGAEFSRVSGGLMSLAIFVAMRVISLNSKQEVDPRFFKRPSGGGGPETSRTKTTSVNGAAKARRRRATADDPETTAIRPDGMSDPSQSPFTGPPRAAE